MDVGFKAWTRLHQWRGEMVNLESQVEAWGIERHRPWVPEGNCLG